MPQGSGNGLFFTLEDSIDDSSRILYKPSSSTPRLSTSHRLSCRTPVGNHAHCKGLHLGCPSSSPGPVNSGRGNRMDVSTQIGRDHPIDLKRVVTNPDGSVTHEHLLTFIPVQFRGGTVKFCFVGRSDVDILREGARNCNPPQPNLRRSARFTNLAMTLKAGDLIRVGTGLSRPPPDVGKPGSSHDQGDDPGGWPAAQSGTARRLPGVEPPPNHRTAQPGCGLSE